ncbi:DUF362 domain-containing protein [Candidatus Bathyarchaeota archaeon]|nr:DUF362 domain-containing protein [Candidatus Bathyarchaeota archaeon]
MSNKVAIVRVNNSIDETTRKSVGLLGDFKIKSGIDVIIKPNICNSKNPQGMVITDFNIIKSAINIIREKGGNPIVVESDNIDNTADIRVKKSGLLDVLNELNVNFINLSKEESTVYKINEKEINIPKIMLDAGYVVNLSKMKTCGHTLVTLSIKNLYGCFKEAKKSKYHKHLDEILPLLAKTIKSDLNIVDGLICMEGNGPVVGNPINMGVIVSGFNPVSVDSLCSKLMGFDPTQIKHIDNSAKMGIGSLEFEAVGDPWQPLICNFERPFSIKATLKSVSAIKDVYLKK